MHVLFLFIFDTFFIKYIVCTHVDTYDKCSKNYVIAALKFFSNKIFLCLFASLSSALQYQLNMFLMHAFGIDCGICFLWARLGMFLLA